MSRRKSSVQEELFIMIYKLIEKKTSEIFREPVDPVTLPDYYEKIKNPIDISTIIKKMKKGTYEFSYEVRDDFRLLITNCRHYNVRMDILRLAEKFQKSIETEWGNFEKECRKEDLNMNDPLNVTEDSLKAFEAIEEKYNRKPQMLQNILGELQQTKKHSSDLKVLPPIPKELLQGDKQNQELPSYLAYKSHKYSAIKGAQRASLLSFELQTSDIAVSFEEISKKKIAKYKKILFKKLQWIQKKIFMKCLERKRFKKMSSVQFLVNYLQNDKLTNGLQLKNIQMYVKMVAYWIEEYPEILSFQMKSKFIDTCKAIKKAIFRVLRYRRLPRTTKISINDEGENNPSHAQGSMMEQQPVEEFGDDDTKKYENEIKNFKRMLTKDQSETIKKYTKIIIKLQNGEWTIADFASESANTKKPNRIGIDKRREQNTDENQRLKEQKRKQEEKLEDEQFLASFNVNNTIQLINNFQDKLEFDWDELFLSRLPETLELKPENFVMG